MGVTYCVLELYNLWYSFSRSLYLSAAFGARDGSGVRVAVAVSRPGTVDDALTHVIRLNPRHATKSPPWMWMHEPNWANTTNLLSALNAVGASNTSQVSAGLSAPSTVFGGIIPFRHFFAHRGRDTLQNLHAIILPYSISPTLRPTEVMLSRAVVLGVPRPQSLLLDWIDEVLNTIAIAI